MTGHDHDDQCKPWFNFSDFSEFNWMSRQNKSVRSGPLVMFDEIAGERADELAEGAPV